MAQILILNFTLFLYLYYLGNKIIFLTNSFFKSSISDNKIYLNFIFSIFFLTFLILFLNFFIPININFIFIVFVTSILLISFNFKFGSRQTLIKLFIASVILVPLVFNNGPGHDGGLYHIPFQTWIKNHNITFGLTNLHSRYSLATGTDYFSSIFWLNNNFIFLSFLPSVYLIIFFSFFYEVSKNQIFFYLILPTYLLFPIWQRYVHFDYAGVDFYFGILVILFFLQYLRLLDLRKFNKHEFNNEFVVFCILFSLVIISKPTGIVFSLLFLHFLYFLYRSKKLKLLQNTNLVLLLIPFALIFLWIIKNFIISGCLIYPLEITCFNVTWGNYSYLKRDLLLIQNFKIHFNDFFNYLITKKYILFLGLSVVTFLFLIKFKIRNLIKKKYIDLSLVLLILILLFNIDISSLRGFSELSNSSEHANNTSKRNLIIFIEMLRLAVTISVSILIAILLIKKNADNIILSINYKYSFQFIFLIILFFTWLMTSPDPRLAFWVFALLPTSLCFLIILNYKLKNIFENFSKIINVFLILNFLVFGFSQFHQDLNKNMRKLSFFHEIKLENSSKIIKRKNFGYTPVNIKNGNPSWNHCLNFIDCYYNPQDVVLKKKFLIFKQAYLKN